MDEISENTLNEELNKLFLEKNSLQRTLCLTEYDMEIQNLGRRNSEDALNESQRELESQRRRLLEVSQWTDQAQRERIHLRCRLEMKSRLRKERYARSCREIEELKRREQLPRFECWVKTLHCDVGTTSHSTTYVKLLGDEGFRAFTSAASHRCHRRPAPSKRSAGLVPPSV